MGTTPLSNQGTYQGKELDIFVRARRWKRYWAGFLRPYVAGDTLEVGAGLGANTTDLLNPRVRSIVCIEPDPTLASRLVEAVGHLPSVSVRVGTIDDISSQKFDTILYIDVLEHIQDDKLELSKAAERLRPGGRLILLAPAHQFLFSPFDAAIGHYRRYDKRALNLISPLSCRLAEVRYLDCVGLLASAANRVIMKQKEPTLRQILFWDGYMIPVSRVLDRLVGFRAGKSIFGVWIRDLRPAITTEGH